MLVHNVLVVDQCEGRAIDDFDTAGEFAQAIDYPVLIERVAETAQSLSMVSSAPGRLSVGERRYRSEDLRGRRHPELVVSMIARALPARTRHWA